jgi:hypothetical protein
MTPSTQKELLSNAQAIGSLEQQYRIYSAELRRRYP